MKKCYIDKDFRGDSIELINTANQICNSYARQGYDLSLRQLYYQMVTKNILANTEQNYKRLGSIISDARLAGLIDWDMIKDRGRECVTPSHWDTPADILDACARQFRIDTWATQPNYVCVMVEKQALEGVLEPVCRELDIPFMANKGYSSSSALYEMGRVLHRAFFGEGHIDDYGIEAAVRHGDYEGEYFTEAPFADSDQEDAIQKAIDRDEYEALDRLVLCVAREYMKPHPKGGRAIHVIYLGDHDPSGIDMTRDVADRLALFAECPVNVHRLALNMDQVRQYNPPENPAKTTDSRAESYIRKFGTSSWELDALEPALLARLVRSHVGSLRDDLLYEAALAKQQSWRDDLAALKKRFEN